MNRTITIWAAVGVFAALFWAFYAAMTFPASMKSHPIVWILAQFTCPIAFASAHFHFGVRLVWVVVANALTYALFGVIVEGLRRQLHHVGSSQ